MHTRTPGGALNEYVTQRARLLRTLDHVIVESWGYTDDPAAHETVHLILQTAAIVDLSLASILAGWIKDRLTPCRPSS
ncbi:MAG: hypothetical protein ACRDP4_12085 [Nocardioidaceae bacterium]